MSWNYRIVRRSMGDDGKPLPEPFFGIYEAYYEDEAERPDSITLTPVAPIGESVEELRAVLLEMMARALNEPVLEWESFESRENAGGEQR